jgi:ectoine hydroxylase-related dioxygenase (phytanoyl-CoA dioxygenase family)
MFDAVANGRSVPGDLLGELLDSRSLIDDSTALRERLSRDGYVFLSGALDDADVALAREEAFGRLRDVGEIREPASEGITTGESKRRDMVGDLGAFWRSVSEGAALRKVTHGQRLRHLAEMLLGEPAIGQDFLFLRAAPVGRATGIHCDAPFFTRMTDRVLTCWLALGPVPVTDGPLFVIEDSHKFEDLVSAMKGFDLMRDKEGRKATVVDDPIQFAFDRGARLLTRNFELGDCLIFGMYTFHGAFDNHSKINRARLTCDVRYQPASEPLDPRYFGPEPTGTTGAGYGELNGAKPLTEPWHVR